LVSGAKRGNLSRTNNVSAHTHSLALLSERTDARAHAYTGVLLLMDSPHPLPNECTGDDVPQRHDEEATGTFLVGTKARHVAFQVSENQESSGITVVSLVSPSVGYGVSRSSCRMFLSFSLDVNAPSAVELCRSFSLLLGARTHTHTHTLSLSRAFTRVHTHTHTHTYTYSLSLSHVLTHTLSHSLFSPLIV
jgi:hypothetical protein